MKILRSSHCHTLMDCGLTPAVSIEPGESLVIETLDACYGRVRSVEDFRRYCDDPQRQSDPLTGPVYIAGALPGGALVVDIVDIELDKVGFQLIGPQRAIIRDEVPDWDCYEVQIRNDKICLRNLEMPIDPIVGTLGNAPAGMPTNHPNRLGGNLDCPQIRIGTRVYLPVEVPGALFFLGDVHARQGDGEIVGAPEIGARVTVKFQVLDAAHAAWPMVEDATHWHTITCGVTEEDAIRIGAFETARFIQNHYDVSFNDALVLLTMCVSLRTSRTGGHGDLERVVCTSFSKDLLAKATQRHS